MQCNKATLVSDFKPEAEMERTVGDVYELIAQDTRHTSSGEIDLAKETREKLTDLLHRINEERLRKYLEPYSSAEIRTVMGEDPLGKAISLTEWKRYRVALYSVFARSLE